MAAQYVNLEKCALLKCVCVCGEWKLNKGPQSHIAPKNACKTLGALLSPFFQWARAVALRRRLSLLSNHQLRSLLQEGNFVTWPAVRLRHSEKLRCFYLDAARTRLEKTSASLCAFTFEITNLSVQKTRYVSGPLRARIGSGVLTCS